MHSVWRGREPQRGRARANLRQGERHPDRAAHHGCKLQSLPRLRRDPPRRARWSETWPRPAEGRPGPVRLRPARKRGDGSRRASHPRGCPARPGRRPRRTASSSRRTSCIGSASRRRKRPTLPPALTRASTTSPTTCRGQMRASAQAESSLGMEVLPWRGVDSNHRNPLRQPLDIWQRILRAIPGVRERGPRAQSWKWA